MKWMNSTFEPRQFPEAIMLRDEATVLGPFCVHCGAPLGEHGPRRRCPSVVSPLYPPPACKCHGVREAVTR
jgi:hypothetical protein